jgi:hypothetical protein
MQCTIQRAELNMMLRQQVRNISMYDGREDKSEAEAVHCTCQTTILPLLVAHALLWGKNKGRVMHIMQHAVQHPEE